MEVVGKGRAFPYSQTIFMNEGGGLAWGMVYGVGRCGVTFIPLAVPFSMGMGWEADVLTETIDTEN